MAKPRDEAPWTLAERPTFPKLRRDLAVDVAVVGAGIAGLSVAYFAARAGQRVALFSAGPLGSGMTGATTGHLASAIDARFYQIEEDHGRRAARLVARSHQQASDAIERLVREERIDCGFERLPGFLFEPAGGDGAVIARELAAARRAGLRVRRHERLPLDDFASGPCLEFPAQGQFHPLRYLAGLARAACRAGVKIYRGRVEAVAGGRTAHVTVGDRTVSCGAVVVATRRLTIGW